MTRIPVAIFGATGAVGQRFVQLLESHPWFEVVVVAASDRSEGQRYAEACRWLLPTPMPEAVHDLVIQPVTTNPDCRLVFSALPSAVAGEVEEGLAQAGYGVCSNAAAHRLDADVPLLIPEVNSEHTALIEEQRRTRGWQGAVVSSANCSTTQLALVLKPLHDAFGLRQLSVVTMQAVSGAGYPGLSVMDTLGNVIPLIRGEEEKIERESVKLLGTLQGGQVTDAAFAISAQCNRVPVRDGHMECVSVEFERRPDIGDLIAALDTFRGPRAVAELPSSPDRPIYVHQDEDRPQPLRDCNLGRGMTVSVGRVRECPVLSARFVILGHNTIRGAAAGAIHNAELLVAQEWVS